VSCWGGEQYIGDLATQFHVGHVGKIHLCILGIQFYIGKIQLCILGTQFHIGHVGKVQLCKLRTRFIRQGPTWYSINVFTYFLW
jgi:hypothetical protein